MPPAKDAGSADVASDAKPSTPPAASTSDAGPADAKASEAKPSTPPAASTADGGSPDDAASEEVQLPSRVYGWDHSAHPNRGEIQEAYSTCGAACSGLFEHSEDCFNVLPRDVSADCKDVAGRTLLCMSEEDGCKRLVKILSDGAWSIPEQRACVDADISATRALEGGNAEASNTGDEEANDDVGDVEQIFDSLDHIVEEVKLGHTDNAAHELEPLVSMAKQEGDDDVAALFVEEANHDLSPAASEEEKQHAQEDIENAVHELEREQADEMREVADSKLEIAKSAIRQDTFSPEEAKQNLEEARSALLGAPVDDPVAAQVAIVAVERATEALQKDDVDRTEANDAVASASHGLHAAQAISALDSAAATTERAKSISNEEQKQDDTRAKFSEAATEQIEVALQELPRAGPLGSSQESADDGVDSRVADLGAAEEMIASGIQSEKTESNEHREERLKTEAEMVAKVRDTSRNLAIKYKQKQEGVDYTFDPEVARGPLNQPKSKPKAKPRRYSWPKPKWGKTPGDSNSGWTRRRRNSKGSSTPKWGKSPGDGFTSHRRRVRRHPGESWSAGDSWSASKSESKPGHPDSKQRSSSGSKPESKPEHPGTSSHPDSKPGTSSRPDSKAGYKPKPFKPKVPHYTHGGVNAYSFGPPRGMLVQETDGDLHRPDHARSLEAGLEAESPGDPSKDMPAGRYFHVGRRSVQGQ